MEISKIEEILIDNGSHTPWSKQDKEIARSLNALYEVIEICRYDSMTEALYFRIERLLKLLNESGIKFCIGNVDNHDFYKFIVKAYIIFNEVYIREAIYYFTGGSQYKIDTIKTKTMDLSRLITIIENLDSCSVEWEEFTRENRLPCMNRDNLRKIKIKNDSMIKINSLELYFHQWVKKGEYFYAIAEDKDGNIKVIQADVIQFVS